MEMSPELNKIDELETNAASSRFFYNTNEINAASSIFFYNAKHMLVRLKVNVSTRGINDPLGDYLAKSIGVCPLHSALAS